MKVTVSEHSIASGRLAGGEAARLIRKAIAQNGQANIILATGTSQFETLTQLINEDIDWGKVVMFHLDEYIGLPDSSPASFRKYLKERFLAKVPGLQQVYLVNGEGDSAAECDRLGEIIARHPIDVALVGIGENGHLGFNDPPADFETEAAFIVVSLDEACRKQQFGEGWFGTLGDVPRQAITMSIQQIMRSKHIICSVPDSRKAVAVYHSVEGPVGNLHPASILQLHPDCACFLDMASSALLTGKKFDQYERTAD
jgi:glucosamine-6-phosphate deaminase